MALAINIVLGANTVHFSRNIQKATQNAKKYLQGFALLAYMQAADKDKSVQDFLIIDPNPMTDEQKKAFTKRFVNEIKQSLSRGRTDA